VAYAPEFYVPENIIGYTGVLDKNPTVYFLSATHYGHITQVHEKWRNVGRETIRPNAKYKFGNTGKRNVLHEHDYLASLRHTSRSPMILVGQTIPPELSHAIMVHTEQKALRGADAPVVGAENLARKHHPGQEPSEAERATAGKGVLFVWEGGRGQGVPAGTRLYALTGAGAAA
jgi:hypothetical protein